MTNHERVKLAFGGIKAPEGLADEILYYREGKTTGSRASEARAGAQGRRRIARIFVIAATICLVLGLTVTAIATDFFGLFGLRERVIPKEHPEYATYWNPETGETTPQPFQILSMSGYAGRPEYAAFTEWREYIDTLDTDAIAAHAGSIGWQTPEEYWGYPVDSPEMADKLAEIVEKYDLDLFGRRLDLRTQAEMEACIADGPFFKDDGIKFMGYAYSSGTFQFDAEGTYNFQLRHSRKGVFDTVYVRVFNLEAYDEWNYENIDGVPLRFAQGDGHAFIFAETDTAYITVTISDGISDRSDLEQFADLINFGNIRSEILDLTEIFGAQQGEMNLAVAHIVGRWTLVSSKSADGAEIPVPDEANGLFIKEDRWITIWRGEEALATFEGKERDVNNPTAEVLLMEGEITPIGENEFTIKISSMLLNIEVPWEVILELEMPTQYDPATGLLKYTDWDNVTHTFTRDP